MSSTVSPDVARERARVAALSRSRAETDPDFIHAKSELAAAKIRAYVDRVVAEAPPLTEAQREAIIAAFVGIKVGAS